VETRPPPQQSWILGSALPGSAAWAGTIRPASVHWIHPPVRKVPDVFLFDRHASSPVLPCLDCACYAYTHLPGNKPLGKFST